MYPDGRVTTSSSLIRASSLVQQEISSRCWGVSTTVGHTLYITVVYSLLQHTVFDLQYEARQVRKNAWNRYTGEEGVAKIGYSVLELLREFVIKRRRSPIAEGVIRARPRTPKNSAIEEYYCECVAMPRTAAPNSFMLSPLQIMMILGVLTCQSQSGSYYPPQRYFAIARLCNLAIFQPH